MSCENDVVSSVMEVFVRTDEYKKAYDFANVKPGDNKAKIIFGLKVKFADSIATV